MPVRLAGLEAVEIERLRQRVGRLFSALQEASEMITPLTPGEWVPPADLCECENEITVFVEIPGVRGEHVEITLSGNRLRITGRKRKGAPRAVISHLCSERDYGKFTRELSLHWPVRVNDSSATLKDGVLTIRLPKLKERRGGQFKIPLVSDE